MAKLRIAMLMLLVFFLVRPAVTQAGGELNFQTSLPKENPAVNSTFTVEIAANPVTDLYAYELNLTYDRTKLQFVSYTAGEGGFNIDAIMTNNGVRLAHTELEKKSGKNGEIKLAAVTFKALESGDAPIVLSGAKLVNSQLAAVTYTPDVSAVAHIVSTGDSNGNNGNNGNNNAGGNGSSVQPATPSPVIGSAIKPVIRYDAAAQSVQSTVDLEALQKALDQAIANDKGVKKVIIEVESKPGAKEYIQTFPASAISGGVKQAEFEIVTALATVTIPDNMLPAGFTSNEQISLHITSVEPASLQPSVLHRIGNHPVIQITLMSGGKTLTWDNRQAPVTVSIPYAPAAQELLNPEHIVVWYIDSRGELIAVPNGRYDANSGRISFKTTHFSMYAAGYVNKSFMDIQSVEWAKHPVEVMASKGIINGVSDTEFRPSQAVTRADFLVLLVRTLELGGKAGDRFADVPDQAYYYEAVGIARSLGIAEGSGDNLFKPLEPITREDMMVLTARALKASGQQAAGGDTAVLQSFSDARKISPYASESVASLVKAGLIHGNGSQIEPKSTTTRAEAAVLMYNLYNL